MEKRKRTSIQRNLNCWIIAIILMMLILEIICISIQMKMIYDEQRSATHNIAVTIREKFEKKINIIEAIQRQNVKNVIIREFLDSHGQDWNLRQSLRENVTYISNIIGETFYFTLFDVDLNFYSFSDSGNDFQNQLQEICKNYMETGQNTRLTRMNAYANESFLVSIEPITSLNVDRVETNLLGLSVVFMPVNSLQLKADMYYPSGCSIVLSELNNGEEIFNLGENEYSREEKSLFTETMQLSGFPIELTVALQFNPTNSNIFYSVVMLILEAVFIVIFILLFCAYIRRSLIFPIQQIRRFLDDWHIGGRKTALQLKTATELADIADAVTKMIERNRRQMHNIINMQSTLYEKDLAVHQIELKMLRLQINPHFLYNTLDCIKGMALQADDMNVVSMVVSLADMMRYSLESRQVGTVREEIDLLKSYCSIFRMRSPGKFEVIYEVDEDILDCRMDRFILQPVVENAIIHGFHRQKGRLLKIVVRIVEKDIVFTVFDNGVGIPSEKLCEIRKELSYTNRNSKEEEEMSFGVGLKNVDSRLKLSYGERCGIQISSEQGQYTEIEFRIPRFCEKPRNTDKGFWN